MVTRSLPALVAIGIVVAGLVLWRFRPARQIRWIGAAMTAYGVLAFAHAAVAGIALRGVLAGHGLFAPLPYILQGAFVGAFVVLPIGWMVSLISAGIPRFHEGSPRRAFYQAVALTVCVGLVLTSLPDEGSSSRARSVASSSQSTAARLTSLENNFRAIEDGERASPRDHWDPDYVVQMAGRDPQGLFEWVRDNTFWIPYRGVLRGPVGVLMDRQGNSLDRALLLAALLRHAGHEVRLAHGRLGGEAAIRILPDLVNRRSVLLTEPSPIDNVDSEILTTAARYGFDSAAVARNAEGYERVLNGIDAELARRASTQTSRLLDRIQQPDSQREWNQRFAMALDALSDHWWVQQREGTTWSDHDLLAQPGAGAPLTTAEEAVAIEELADALYHQVAVSIVAEQWSNNSLKQERVLHHVLKPCDLIGAPIVVQFWPGSWPATFQSDPNGKFGLRGVALEQDKWMALLSVNKKVVGSRIISKTTSTPDPADANPFSALTSAAGKAFSQDPVTSPNAAAHNELTAVWLEYEIRDPGEPVRTFRRVVFDLIDPATRSVSPMPPPAFDESHRLKRSLALMMRTEILPIVSEAAPEFVTHLIAKTLLAERDVLRAAHRWESSEPFPDAMHAAELLADAPPPVSSLYSLAIARTGWGRREIVIDRLNILSRHQYPAFMTGVPTFRDDIDIVVNDVGVDLAEIDAFAIRLTQGVLDTNAEALVGMRAAAHENTGQAFELPGDWLTLTATERDRVGQLELSEASRVGIRQDLATGYVLVVPKRPIRTAIGEFTGWWRVDSTTGAALGVNADGWGAAGVDYGRMLENAAMSAGSFLYEYELCQAIPAAAAVVEHWGGRVHNGNVLGYREVIKQSVAESHATCTAGAIVAGALVTLPLVVLTLKYSRVPRRIGAALEVSAVRSAAPPPVPRPTQPFMSFKGPPRFTGAAKGVTEATAPVGRGAYQVNVEGLTRWMRQDPDAQAAKILGKPEWYEQANRAARSAYNRARAAGYRDAAARQYSFEIFEGYVKQAKGKILGLDTVVGTIADARLLKNAGVPELPTGQGGKTVALVLSTALLSFIPKPTFTDSTESK
jgi:hypothetical protein